MSRINSRIGIKSDRKSMYKITEYFGWFNLVTAFMVLVGLPFLGHARFHDKSAVVLILLMQGVVSAAMIYASRQKSRGSVIGDKAYPASIASYVLFALIGYRWYWYGG